MRHVETSTSHVFVGYTSPDGLSRPAPCASSSAFTRASSSAIVARCRACKSPESSFRSGAGARKNGTCERRSHNLEPHESRPFTASARMPRHSFFFSCRRRRTIDKHRRPPWLLQPQPRSGKPADNLAIAAVAASAAAAAAAIEFATSCDRPHGGGLWHDETSLAARHPRLQWSQGRD